MCLFYFLVAVKRRGLVLGWDICLYAGNFTCAFLPKCLYYHSPPFPTSFMCCPWLVLESCEVWLKLAGELMFPVLHHTIKMLKCLKVEDAQYPNLLVTTDSLKNLTGLFENFKRKHLLTEQSRKPGPRQEGSRLWLALHGYSDGGAPSAVLS